MAIKCPVLTGHFSCPYTPLVKNLTIEHLFALTGRRLHRRPGPTHTRLA
nr:MAG TPA: hypothetical protein [Caudoviricetes sp.]